MSEVDKKFEEFIDKIKELEPATKVETIPEVFGIQYKEVYITKWIAYLLRQSFGYKILNVLLKTAKSKINVSENEVIEVHTEYVFKGYTYDSYFPEVTELAEFINKAYRDGKDIICQAV